MEIHLKIIGTLLVLLALVHIRFPKYFHWKKELSSLSLINRQMMQVHTFFIALILLLMGLLCLTSANELVETSIGKKISVGLAVFWLARLFIQFFVYSTKLWRGKLLETSIHIIFSALWIYFSTIFIAIHFN